MHVPKSWRTLTGWKAVLAAIPIVGLISLKVWFDSRDTGKAPRYHRAVSESVEVPGSLWHRLPSKLQHDGMIKLEVTEFSGGQYGLYIMTEEALDGFQVSLGAGGDPENPENPRHRESKTHT